MKINFAAQPFTSNFKYLNKTSQPDIYPDLLKIIGSDLNYFEQDSLDWEMMAKGIMSQAFLTVDDSYDSQIEALLKSRGIEFRKTSVKETLNKDNIALRIALTPFDESLGRKLALLNTDKLEECFQRSDFYIDKEELHNPLFGRCKKVFDFLKLNCQIHASSIVLKEKDDSLCAEFIDGRHRFCAMRDLGMEKIPVALSDESIQLAQKWGLLAK